MMKIGQVVAEKWMYLDPSWSVSSNCETAKTDHYTPYLHNRQAPMQYVDTKRQHPCDWSHFGSEQGPWRFVGPSMVASILPLYLTKGKSKFHPTTTKRCLLTCFIRVCEERLQ